LLVSEQRKETLPLPFNNAKKPKQNILGHGSDLGDNAERLGARMMSPPMESWNV
jgi:hypothetical protein